MPALSSHAVFVALVAICLGIVWIANPRGGVSPSSPDAGLPAQIQPEVRTASLAEPDDPVCAASACLRALAPSGGAVHMPAVHAACGEAIEDVGAASSGRNGHNGRSNGRNNGQSSCAAADEAEAALRLWAKGLRSLALQWMRRAVAHAQAEAEGASAAEEAQSQPSDTTDVQQMHDEAIENHKHPGKTTEGKPLKSNAQQDKTGAIDTQDTGGTTAPPQVSKGEAVARMESTAAKMALQMGYGEEAALLVSAALARRLRLAGPDAVAPTLMQSAGRAPEDLAWLAEAEAAQPAVAQDLDTLLSAALLTHALPLANALHLILAAVRPTNTAVAQLLVDFSMSVGLVEQGLNAALRSLQTMHEQAYPHDDSYGAVMRSAVLLLTAGADSHTVTMARRLLAVRALDELKMMGENCGIDLTHLYGRNTIAMDEVRRYFDACVASADLVAKMVEKGADVTTLANGFGFSSAHNAAAVGGEKLWKALVEKKADVSAANSMQQTPAHIAAMRGSVAVLRALKAAKMPLDEKDRWGRTPFDIACMHRWAVAPIAEILGKKPSDCRKEFQQPKTAPDAEHSKPLAVGGGWRIRKADAKRRVPCEIDAIDGLTADAFVIDYLSVQRPVLVKNALSSPAWRQLLPLWTREEIERRLGHIEVAVGTIPYAERFEKESNTTTIDEYIDMMDDLYAAHVDGIEPPNPPGYVFESLGVDSPLRRLVAEPPVVSADVTEINPRNLQFYLGPAESGAPMHVHRGAWNALVYGRKRWFLSPPPHAVYSTKHPREWLLEDYPALRAAGGVLECVQESGDVLFVPEAWGHATLNLAESIGAASEFEWGMSEFAIDPPPEPEEVAGADEDEADSALLDGAAAGEMGGGSDADEDKVYTAMPM